MDRDRRPKVIIRFSLLATAVTAMFWAVWYLIVGSVPEVSGFRWSESSMVALPFAVSRGWDILYAAAGTAILFFAATSPRVRDSDGLAAGNISEGILIFCVGISLVVSLAVGLSTGPGIGLIVGLILGLVCGLACCTVCDLTTGLIFGLTYGLAASLAFGLVLGLTYGLAFNLAASLVFGAITGLIYGLKALCSLSFWRRFGHWLIADYQEE